MIAVLRYGNGMPHFRLEGLQASLYVPLPDATQWDIVSKAVPAPRAAFEELIRQAAQAPLLHSDDTPMKVLSLMKERARAEAGGVKPAAKAINTSGIVAVLQDNDNEQRKVVLFFTGHAHAGKNMAARPGAPGRGTAAADADVRRAGGQHRRRVHHRSCATAWPMDGARCVDVAEQFPEAARHVDPGPGQGLRARRAVPRASLFARAAPVVPSAAQPAGHGSSHTWITRADSTATQVEPNSGLGKALNYLTQHWSELTSSCARPARRWTTISVNRPSSARYLHRKGSALLQDGPRCRGRRRLHEPDPHLQAVRCQPVRLSATRFSSEPRR